MLRLCAFAALLLMALPAFAQSAPAFIPVQGMLADAESGEAIDGVRSVVFKLYSDADGTDELFSETHAVTFTSGAFFVGLGTVLPLDLDLFAENSSMYLKVEVDGDTDMPLFPIGSTPYAARAQTAEDSDTLEGLTAQAVAALKVESDPTVNPLAQADLTCVAGNIPHYDGNEWFCGGADFEEANVSGTLTAAAVSATDINGTSGVFSGNVTVATPSMNGHAANKGYVDGAVSAAQSYADKFDNAIVAACGLYDDAGDGLVCESNTCWGGASCDPGSAFQDDSVNCPAGTTLRAYPAGICTRN